MSKLEKNRVILRRYHILLLAISVVGIVLLALVAYQISSRNMENSYRLSYETAMNNSSRVLEMNLDMIVEASRGFLNDVRLQEIARESTYEGMMFHNEDQRNLEKVFRNLSQQQAYVNSIIFMDLHGHHFLLSNVNRGSYEYFNYYSEHDFLEEAWTSRVREEQGKEVFFGNNVLNAENGDVFCMCKYMINPSDSTPMGYLVITLSRNLIRQSYVSLGNSYRSNRFLVVDTEGEPIFFDGSEEERVKIERAYGKDKNPYVFSGVRNAMTGWTLLNVAQKGEIRHTSNRVFLLVLFGGGALLAIVFWVLRLSFSNHELSEHLMKVQLNEREAEILLLQSQINPHFLYNTLDSLYFMAIVHGDDQIADMVMALSNNFKLALNRGSKYITVSDSIRWIQDYMKIQNMRYHDRFTLVIDIQPEIMEKKILAFILQPFVENAMYHGLEAKIGKGSILLSGKADTNGMEFVIQDDGIGIDDLSVLEKGYGIRNVRERIRLNYGDSYGVFVESRRNEGTRVTVRVPMEERDNVSSGGD